MEQATRRRGRPVGATTKKSLLSGASVERICDFHKYNPVEHLIRIANNSDPGREWDPIDQARAVHKLADLIHGRSKLASGLGDGDTVDGQYSIIFEEDSADFALPCEAGAAGAPEVMRLMPVHSPGDTQARGQDSLCD